MIRSILKTAMSLIPKQSAVLYRWQGRITNDRGLDVDTYSPAESFTGSIQPVDRSKYEYMGLDATKGYITVYTTQIIVDLTRTHNPDHIEYGGRRYKVLNRSDWHSPADFNGLMAMDIGPATGEESHASDGE